jgi:putative MATE family efflux protein
MWTLFLANGLNMVLDPLLIFGMGPFPELGLKGAAVASMVGRGCGVVFQVFVLVSGRRAVRIALTHLCMRLSVQKILFRLSLGATAQQIVETASWLFLVRIIASFGPSAVAGYTVAMRILAFAFLPAWGLSNAAATLVGQNLGAKRPERAESTVWRTAGWSAGALFLVMLLFIPLGEPLIRLFVEEPDVVRQGTKCLHIISYGYVAFAVGMVTLQAFNGAGDTITPLWSSVVSLWLVKLPLAYVLSHHLFGEAKGVYISVTIAYSIMAVIAAFLFRLGRWKQRVL